MKRFVRVIPDDLLKICEIDGICGSNFGIWVFKPLEGALFVMR